MWRNREVDAFVRWLRDYNLGHAYEDMAGFYGLDLYNLSGSMRAVIDFLEREDPEAAKLARKRYGCLEPWAENPARYGAVALSEGYARCEVGVAEMMRELTQRNFNCLTEACDEWLDAAANARLVKNAEAYYRVMYHGSEESWNLRDTHMFETLCHLLEGKGSSPKAIVWAHNSHIGNPQTERQSHYAEAVLPKQFDAFVWFDETHAVSPLPGEPRPGQDETYPFGL
jgi:erythromycin esterase-like protein